MKKILLLITSAFVSMSAMAATESDVKIYLNAGHGSWGPNDRPMETITYPFLSTTGRPDTCGFYESNTNLWKALYCEEALKKMGVPDNMIMQSRVKTDLSLMLMGTQLTTVT